MLDNRKLRLGLVGLLAMALGAAGCAAQADVEQVSQNEQSMRQLIANDQQQMAAMHDQIARLNDRITELRAAGIVAAGEAGYRLTAEGRELLAVYGPLDAWAERWADRARAVS